MHHSPSSDPICSSREQTFSFEANLRPKNPDSGAEEGGCVILQMEQSKQDLARSKAAQTIEPCVAYMMKHLDKPLRVSTLSALIRHSSSHFFSVFKCATGQAPIRFFIRARMQRACRLLKETAFSVKEIAALLGYDDAFYFSRLFKSIHGVAPREYRARIAASGRGEGNELMGRFQGLIGEGCRPQHFPAAQPGESSRVDESGSHPTTVLPARPRLPAAAVHTSRRLVQTNQAPFIYNKQPK